MVCIFSRGMLGASALMIAACASAPSQQQPIGSVSSSTRGDDIHIPSSGVFIQMADGGIRVTLAAASPNSFGATQVQPQGGNPFEPKSPENVALGGSEPLYLLDGVPYTPGSGGLIIGLDPHEIESIKAVKDPAELALYGMRGGNGVIAIKTKRPGAKSDSTKQRPMD